MSDQRVEVPDFGCGDRCADRAMHEFYMAGAGFRWCRPRFDHLRPAFQGVRVGLNRYPHNVIGAYVSVLGHGLGVRWKRTPRG